MVGSGRAHAIHISPIARPDRRNTAQFWVGRGSPLSWLRSTQLAASDARFATGYVYEARASREHLHPTSDLQWESVWEMPQIPLRPQRSTGSAVCI
jgi:hypothetical protein